MPAKSISNDPRARAFELNKKRAECEKEGHLHQVVSWYNSSRNNKLPCRRCGEDVPVKVDWSGHP